MEVTPSQLVTLLREGTAPRKARAAIAQCTLPLPPAPLLESLDILADDPELGIQAQALTSLSGCRRPRARGGVRARRLPASSTASRGATPARGRRARRRAQPGGRGRDAGALAEGPFPAVLAAIGGCREQLERSPEIVAALLANEATPVETVRLWQERQGGRPAAEATVAGAAADEPAEAGHTFDAGPHRGGGGARSMGRMRPRPVRDEAQSARQNSIYSLLKRMTMGQKVGLATKGNREARNILIRENNKMICLKVLENPRVGDSDVEAWAKSTNVPDDVLRGIANNKEWCRKYSIMKGLVCNPKAPVGISIDFLNRLTLKDLEQLAKNRNVPETVRSGARRLYSVKRDTENGRAALRPRIHGGEGMKLKIGLPKGSLQESTFKLFRKAGFQVTLGSSARSTRSSTTRRSRRCCCARRRWARTSPRASSTSGSPGSTGSARPARRCTRWPSSSTPRAGWARCAGCSRSRRNPGSARPRTWRASAWRPSW